MASSDSENRPLPPPPGTWGPFRALRRAARAPVERFLAVEASSGVILLGAALLALLWANSPFRSSYEALWRIPFGLRLGSWSFEHDLHFWINDGLMTVFFFVVGLEIRREIHQGELSSLRRAAVPFAAALGGMAMPALIYLAWNHGRPSAVGWGVPMATDVAFAVGVLALLGGRVAPPLRILLLALAVIDDVGAIIVIAVFYSSSFSAVGLVVGGFGLALLIAMQKAAVRSSWAYVAPAALVWTGAFVAGVHPTLAGVVVGMMTPARAWFGRERFVELTQTRMEAIRETPRDDDHALHAHLDAVAQARREAVSPLERLQHALHGWVAFGIMPLFALANAGVPLGNARFDEDGWRVFLGVTCGLVVGKPLGVLGLTWLSVRLRISALPATVRWSQVSVVGVSAGIGFTMALFIAQLAFPPGPLLETSKLGILTGSALAAAAAFLVGLRTLPRAADTAATSDAEARSVA